VSFVHAKACTEPVEVTAQGATCVGDAFDELGHGFWIG